MCRPYGAREVSGVSLTIFSPPFAQPAKGGAPRFDYGIYSAIRGKGWATREGDELCPTQAKSRLEWATRPRRRRYWVVSGIRRQVGKRPMSRTEQVKSGFRLAGGIILFCLSLFLVAYGLDAVWSDGHFVSSAWLGWVELSLAAVLIPLTMHLWIKFLAGCIALGLVKSVLVTIAGRDWFPPYLPSSRVQAAAMAFFFAVTLIWLIRFSKTRPELPDRIAIAVYLFFVLGSRNDTHFAIAQAGAGLIALFLASWISWWKRSKPDKQGLMQSSHDGVSHR